MQTQTQKKGNVTDVQQATSAAETLLIALPPTAPALYVPAAPALCASAAPYMQSVQAVRHACHVRVYSTSRCSKKMCILCHDVHLTLHY